MCADEAYCLGRDAGKQSPVGSNPHLSSPCYALACATAHMSPTNPLLPPGLSGRPVVVGWRLGKRRLI